MAELFCLTGASLACQLDWRGLWCLGEQTDRVVQSVSTVFDSGSGIVRLHPHGTQISLWRLDQRLIQHITQPTNEKCIVEYIENMSLDILLILFPCTFCNVVPLSRIDPWAPSLDRASGRRAGVEEEDEWKKGGMDEGQQGGSGILEEVRNRGTEHDSGVGKIWDSWITLETGVLTESTWD